MFKVGEGATPAIPESLSEEGQDFLLCCFLHDPYERHTANQLMDHPFVKVRYCLTGRYRLHSTLREGGRGEEMR